MSIMGFHVAECAGLPPGTMMAASLQDDGRMQITVGIDGAILQRSFTAAQLQEMIDRQTLKFWDDLKAKRV